MVENDSLMSGLRKIIENLSPFKPNLEKRAFDILLATNIESLYKKDGNYLDVGTDSGKCVKAIMSGLRGKGKSLKTYHHIDLVDQSVKKRKKEPEQAANGQFEFTSIPNESLDGVSFFLSLGKMDLDKIQKTLSEAARVIVENGIVFVMEDILDEKKENEVKKYHGKTNSEWKKIFYESGLTVSSVYDKFLPSEKKSYRFYILTKKIPEKLTTKDVEKRKSRKEIEAELTRENTRKILILLTRDIVNDRIDDTVAEEFKSKVESKYYDSSFANIGYDDLLEDFYKKEIARLSYIGILKKKYSDSGLFKKEFDKSMIPPGYVPVCHYTSEEYLKKVGEHGLVNRLNPLRKEYVDEPGYRGFVEERERMEKALDQFAPAGYSRLNAIFAYPDPYSRRNDMLSAKESQGGLPVSIALEVLVDPKEAIVVDIYEYDSLWGVEITESAALRYWYGNKPTTYSPDLRPVTLEQYLANPNDYDIEQPEILIKDSVNPELIRVDEDHTFLNRRTKF